MHPPSFSELLPGLLVALFGYAGVVIVALSRPKPRKPSKPMELTQVQTQPLAPTSPPCLYPPVSFICGGEAHYKVSPTKEQLMDISFVEVDDQTALDLIQYGPRGVPVPIAVPRLDDSKFKDLLNSPTEDI